MSEPLISDGYIIIARKIRKSVTWQNFNLKQRIIALEILLQAQHTAGYVSRNGKKLWLKRGQVATSYQKLADDINLPEITPKVVRYALEKFIKLKLVAKDETKARAKKGQLLTIVNYDIYQNQENYEGKAKGKDKGKEVTPNNNNNNDIPYREIISHLNKKAGTKYSHTSQKNKGHINARFNEGFVLEDFITVIDKKTAEWTGTEWEKFLRPETLFSNKFEGYLNQKVVTKKNGSLFDEQDDSDLVF